MNYEIVTLEEMHVAGFKDTTSNAAPDMGAKIGGLWQRLYGPEMPQFTDRIGENAYGLYTNYASDVNGDYDVLAGFAVQSLNALPAGTSGYTIPAGKYAKFSFVVNMETGAATMWDDVWAQELDRAYTVDFEEYLPTEDMKQSPVNIYIALK